MVRGIIKIVIIYILRLFIKVLYVFPIKNNRIIFNSYRGQQYSCNPKYISQTLVELYPNNFEVIWAFNDPNKFRYLEKQGIILVKFNSLKRFYYEATAKVSINNIGSFSWLPLRKGQEHINTWHSGLDLENCGMNEPANDIITRYTIGLSGRETTLFLAANKVFSDYSAKVQFGYYGMMLNCGLPRGDNLINEKSEIIRKRVRNSFNIDENDIVVMYAPTWRYGGAKDMPKMDYIKLSNSLKKRFGSEFVIWNRSHHLSSNTQIIGDEHLIDVTNYSDIQELVISCDILISDYSSVIWDGALGGKYVIQYAPDAEQFEKERGLYVPVGKWCIPAMMTMEDLCNYLRNINFSEGLKYSKNLLDMMGSYETGCSSEICCRWIADKCFGTHDENSIYLPYLSKAADSPNYAIIEKLNSQESLISKEI
ncbi:MAG: CDP-glycerol glycerophosphotransferase family protein [Clostridiales bacterium]|nr:CDP-glycerol glycerophosphotransferase family protein [Clostridiales bacterium]